MLVIIISNQGLNKHLTIDCDNCIYFGGGASVIAYLYGVSYSIIDSIPVGSVNPCDGQHVKQDLLIEDGL